MSLSATRLSIVKAIVNSSVMGVTASEVADRIGLSPSTVRKHLSALRQEDLIRTVGDGRGYAYAITEDGARLYEELVAPEGPKVAKPRKPAKVKAAESVGPEAAILQALGEDSLGVAELGSKTKIRRNVLQDELNRLVGTVLERERSKGRWIYRRSA